MPIAYGLSSDLSIISFGWEPSALPRQLAGRQGRSISITAQSRRPTPRRLRRAAAQGFIAAAVNCSLGPDSPLPLYNGHRLYLALLPALLDKYRPDWRSQPWLLPTDTPAQCALAWQLARSGGRLALKGQQAQTLSRALYQQLGLSVFPSGTPLEPPCWNGVPLALLEAVLSLSQPLPLGQLARAFKQAGHPLTAKG